MKRVADQAMIEKLQEQISSLQGNRPSASTHLPLGLGRVETAFQGGVFPRGVIHELISYSSEGAVCTSGFLSVILSKLLAQNGFCFWISTLPRRSIFPPALAGFGILPERVMFVDVTKTKDTLWAIEEALKCNALSAVVGEISELSFPDSRRLQLAVEQSGVTGFIHRFRPKAENPVTCVSRWKITPMASFLPGNMPGVGFPRWQVELIKARNGKPGNWEVQWSPEGLEYNNSTVIIPQIIEKQTG